MEALMGMQTPRTWRHRALAVVAAASMTILAACGGTTGEETSSGGGGEAAENLPLVYGVFATPLEEPWDGAIHAALENAVEDGVIEYKHVDNVNTADAVEPNMSVFDNWLQDPAYLAGMLAGGLTKSDVIGVVGAMPIPEVNRIVNAFVQGIKETNPDATVKVSFINTFFDPAAAKQAANAHVAAGADVLFAERDGVIAAAEEADIPAIGMMVDQ